MIGEAPNLVRLLSLSFSRSLILSLSLLLSLSSSISIPRCPVIPLPLATTRRPSCSNIRKENLPLSVASNLRAPFFFRRFLFSAFSSLLQDSLDSLGDYVSCYYSSRGTPPRIPSSSPFLSLSPFPSAFLLRSFCAVDVTPHLRLSIY